MWLSGPVTTVPTDPAVPDAREIDPAAVEEVDPAVDEVVEFPVADGLEEHAAAVIASAAIRPVRARGRRFGPVRSRPTCSTIDLATDSEVCLSMSFSKLG